MGELTSVSGEFLVTLKKITHGQLERMGVNHFDNNVTFFNQNSRFVIDFADVNFQISFLDENICWTINSFDFYVPTFIGSYVWFVMYVS